MNIILKPEGTEAPSHYQNRYRVRHVPVTRRSRAGVKYTHYKPVWDKVKYMG